MQRSPNVKYQAIGRSTCSFDLYVDDGSFAPSLGMTVIGSEKNRKLFAGCIVEIIAKRFMSTTSKIVYSCTAADKASICDHRVVTSATFPADMDAADAIRYIVTNFLNGEGILADGVPDQLGPLGAETKFDMITVTQAFDSLQDLTAAQWWIDLNGVLYYRSLVEAPAAPFGITETSKNWRNLSVKVSLIDYRNRQYLKSNLNLLPGSSLSPSPGGPKRTEGYTIPQAYAVQQALTLGSGLLLFPIVSVVKLTVAGVEKTVKLGTDLTVDLTKFWWFFPGFPYLNAPTSGADVPTTGQVLSIDYIPISQSGTVQSGTPLVPVPAVGITVPPGMSYGTCGSGVFEAVEPVVDVQYQGDADAIAAGILARKSGIPLVVDFETDVPGAMPGMQMQANIPAMYLNNGAAAIPLYITGVQGVSLGDVDLGSGCSFRWQIQASNQLDYGNWLKFYERLVKRIALALPISQYEVATFVLAPGYSVTAGTIATNPGSALKSGKLLKFDILTDSPAVDQDLVLDITADGVSIFGPLKAVLPAGATAATVTVFASDPLYMLQGSRLQISGSYSVTGPNPVPAQSVTGKLYWVF